MGAAQSGFLAQCLMSEYYMSENILPMYPHCTFKHPQAPTNEWATTRERREQDGRLMARTYRAMGKDTNGRTAAPANKLRALRGWVLDKRTA